MKCIALFLEVFGKLKIFPFLPFLIIGHGQGRRHCLHYHTTPTVAFSVLPPLFSPALPSPSLYGRK